MSWTGGTPQPEKTRRIWLCPFAHKLSKNLARSLYVRERSRRAMRATYFDVLRLNLLYSTLVVRVD